MNVKNILFTVLFFALFTPANKLFAQDSIDTTATKHRIWKQLAFDGKFTLQSMGNAFTQPLRWQKNDFITAGSIVAGTSILYLSDNEARTIFKNQNEDVPEFFKEFGWYFGSPQNFFMISAGIYGFGLITDNEKVRHTGVLIIASAATSGIIQSITKTALGRARPNTGNHNNFKPFEGTPGYHSFPSGHSILSFSMAHAIAKQFDSFWAKAGIYTIGSIAPISRLWAEAHWLSDIGVGIAVSIVVVDGVDNFMKRKNAYNYSKPKNISWQLKAGYGTIGLVGTF
ncbi:phosphatase PAP2 family protein [Mariniflexile gromovii]|uniref:Phosphatase PAP2 family protein n=1 Tax=Mariniflexile gromovii TaxID=362523 RepID=A0ABS4BR18_9FLAO|nr:phosphatase PAP2 family protein [Mariniflexile gromovii]MBP0903017.1 phosphatase PAP2 family protein [Mariniflexile gromovii]